MYKKFIIALLMTWLFFNTTYSQNKNKIHSFKLELSKQSKVTPTIYSIYKKYTLNEKELIITLEGHDRPSGDSIIYKTKLFPDKNLLFISNINLKKYIEKPHESTVRDNLYVRYTRGKEEKYISYKGVKKFRYDNTTLKIIKFINSKIPVKHKIYL